MKKVFEGRISVRREKCEFCGTTLNDMGTCPRCDDGEEERLDEVKVSSKGSKPVTVDKFWEYVCAGNDDMVLDICKNDQVPTEFYHRFGRDHSYIMGAIRNGNYSTAKILLTFGGTLANGEGEELALMLINSKVRY